MRWILHKPVEWRILLLTTLVSAGPKLQAAKNGFRLQYSTLHWLLPLKEISNIGMQRLLAFPADKLTTTKENISTHEFINTALTWIFLTHLRGSRAVFKLQLKPGASYFKATSLIHTSDHYSLYKNEQKSWRDCSNLSTNSWLVSMYLPRGTEDSGTEAGLPSLIWVSNTEECTPIEELCATGNSD